MGYTHYWKHDEIGPKNWSILLQGTRTILGDIDAHVKVAGIDGIGEPVVDSEKIGFNGRQDNDEWHESFVITPGPVEFDFCKTARKPYDLAVTTVLLHFAVTLGPRFYFWSDGSWDNEWEETCSYYSGIFGHNPHTTMCFRRPR